MPLRSAYSLRCDFGTADACDGTVKAIPLSITSRDDAVNWAIDQGWRPRPHQQWSCPHCSKIKSVPPRRI
jgi:hypothetical protein